MGNRLSGSTNVTSGVKDQASGATKQLYGLVETGQGGGTLVEEMKLAQKTKDFDQVDKAIKEQVKPFLYNEGRGKVVHIRELVRFRCKDRGINIGKKYQEEVEDLDLEIMSEDTIEFLKKRGSQYKEICWKLEEMGAVGETALHVCLLNATSIHADLAKRLLRNYPKLINDIYISDEYYGENCLHMAIVNEDPAMVKFLLDNGIDVHQRALGNFFTADDQKAKRRDSFEYEWFDMPVETNYVGYTYWGEYPLGFAACLGQEECVRLLVAKGADPNLQDTNGCTILHMLVVHDRKMRDRHEAFQEMFDLLVDLGGKLTIKNRQGLTPLTLAAKLAHKEMYEHILELEREVAWIYGNVTCAAYPLENIDTISETGEINTKSAMYHVVYGDEQGHLGMIDGVISHLLHEKWKTFAKRRFFRRFILFLLYFCIFLLAFCLRPGTDIYPRDDQKNETAENGSIYVVNVTIKDPCYLLKINEDQDIVRLMLEALTVIGATIYVFLSLKEIYHQGYRIFFQTLSASPAKTSFLIANIFVIMLVPGRAACAYVYEDVVGVMAILCTAPYFLFFCRGFKLVGPFVVMIYKMVRTDLLRFFIIYLIFVIGFSQALYVCFRGVESNMFNHPVEACMAMFIMSLGEFADIYDSFSRTRYDVVCKAIFSVYMVLVTLLLVNMLIAMMGNTYQAVAETQGEWLRQWAKIILVVEQTVTTEERRRQQLNYSQPMLDGRRALVIRWHQSQKEQEALKEEREEAKIKQRNMLMKKAEARIQTQIKGSVNVREARDGVFNI